MKDNDSTQKKRAQYVRKTKNNRKKKKNEA